MDDHSSEHCWSQVLILFFCYLACIYVCLQKFVCHRHLHNLYKLPHCNWQNFRSIIGRNMQFALAFKHHKIIEIMILKWSKRTELNQKRQMTGMWENATTKFLVAGWAIYLQNFSHPGEFLVAIGDWATVDLYPCWYHVWSSNWSVLSKKKIYSAIN